MSQLGLSDQIAYRAAHYVDALSTRDDSPSKAARFAMIRYLSMVEKGRREVYGYFKEAEVKILIDRAWDVDWSIADNYDTFWARVEEYCDKQDDLEGLGTRVRRAPFHIIETLVDMTRVKKRESLS